MLTQTGGLLLLKLFIYVKIFPNPIRIPTNVYYEKEVEKFSRQLIAF
jgi:hypothetical protein